VERAWRRNADAGSPGKIRSLGRACGRFAGRGRGIARSFRAAARSAWSRAGPRPAEHAGTTGHPARPTGKSCAVVRKGASAHAGGTAPCLAAVAPGWIRDRHRPDGSSVLGAEASARRRSGRGVPQGLQVDSFRRGRQPACHRADTRSARGVAARYRDGASRRGAARVAQRGRGERGVPSVRAEAGAPRRGARRAVRRVHGLFRNHGQRPVRRPPGHAAVHGPRPARHARAA